MGSRDSRNSTRQPNPGEHGAVHTEAPSCPNASKIANLRFGTPRSKTRIDGRGVSGGAAELRGCAGKPVLVARGDVLVCEAPVAGVTRQARREGHDEPRNGAGHDHFRKHAGRRRFTDVHLEFFGTDRAPLTTPSLCGTYTVEASFQPWTGQPAVNRSSSFQITPGRRCDAGSGPQLSPCADPLPFSPSLISGTINLNAGGFSELTTTFSREDGQQPLSGIELHYPDGRLRAAGRRGRPPAGGTVRRSAGQRRDVRPGKPDRGNGHQRRAGQRSVQRRRGQGVSHRPLQGCPVRSLDREPGEGGPVRSCRKAGPS